MLIRNEVSDYNLALHLPVDIINSDTVQVQFSEDRSRMWVCVAGVCVLRIKMPAGQPIPLELPE